ncbi:NPCBM/NEW2 domain-containing protein [Streptomyces sp. NPDC097704]|uniref:NPCBM/NEW2 domain-containing protein n=1 Tax=Streptomyces sp. NPDC097704 TaxID=3157101 RepID=UPI00331AD6D6
MPWAGAVNGWGPVERDRSNGEQAAGDGRTLTVGGTPYAKGLGTHAASTVTYYLGGTCTGLSTDVGVDDESGSHGSVVFRVFADGTKVAESSTVTGSAGTVHLDAPLTGAYELTLQVTDAGDGKDYDHADWAAPTLTCA